MADKLTRLMQLFRPGQQQEYRPPCDSAELDFLIKIATEGHYPLFFKEWLHECSQPCNKVKFTSIKNAKQHVSQILGTLNRYNDFDKKKMAICSMDDKERTKFIQLFVKLVENKILDNETLKLH